MTLKLELPPEVEAKLSALARAAGQDPASFALGVLRREVERPEIVDHLLSPFRQQVEESGMSDQEFDDLVEEIRNEIWREKHGGKS